MKFFSSFSPKWFNKGEFKPEIAIDDGIGLITVAHDPTLLGDGTNGNPLQLPYKLYVAIINQSGTADPVATVLQNTLSGTPIWTRSSAGEYLLTLTNEFPVHLKVAILSGSTPGVITIVNPGNFHTTAFVISDVISSSQISLTTFINGAAPSDTKLQDFIIEIRVYP